MFSIKYDLLNKPLELKKTHDFCASKKPKLTVVMIHGIASDSTTFRNALKYLEGTKSLNDVRFVTFDLLGSGSAYKSAKLKYNYDEQLGALNRSLKNLQIDTPLVLVGHSMGTLIATRYAATHKKAVQELILCSPPVYTEADLDNPAFAVAIKGFKDAVSVKNKKILTDRAFNNSMEYIVMNRKNYDTLKNITIPTTLIYGDADPIIASFNIPNLIKQNKCLTRVKTLGRHGMSRPKYTKLREILEERLDAKTL